MKNYLSTAWFRLRAAKAKRVGNSDIITLAGCLAVVAAGVALSHTVSEHPMYRARTILDFADALMRNLAWPVREQAPLLFLVALPLAVVGVKYLRSEIKNPAAAEFVLGLGLWGMLQDAALAFGRASLGDSSRYEDVLSAVPIASLGALFVLADNGGINRFSLRTQKWLAVAWVAFCFAGVGWKCRTTLGENGTSANYLEWSLRWELIQGENLRAFIATQDARHLLDQPHQHIPYSSGKKLVELLDDQKILGILPPEFRPSLKLEPEPNPEGAFVLNGVSPEDPDRPFSGIWGSFSTNGLSATGHFVSHPMQAHLPMLDVQLCCAPATQDLKAELVEISTGRRIPLHPRVGDRWQIVTVHSPSSPFRLELTDNSCKSWIAAGDLKEVGRLTYYARKLLTHSVEILLLGLVFLVLLAGGQAVKCSDPGGNRYLVLLAALAMLAFVWSIRNHDPKEPADRLHKKLADWFADRGFVSDAEWHLREALWLRPDDRQARRQLEQLETRATGDSKANKTSP